MNKSNQRAWGENLTIIWHIICFLSISVRYHQDTIHKQHKRRIAKDLLIMMAFSFLPCSKWPVYIFAFGAYNFKQVNVSGIQIFCAQLLALNLRKVILNAANIHIPVWICTHQMKIYIQVFYSNNDTFTLLFPKVQD